MAHNMAGIETLNKIIQLQRQVIGLYSHHHEHCTIVPGHTRVTLEQTLENLRIEYDHLDNPPPRDNTNDLSIIAFSPSDLEGRGTKRNSVEQHPLRKRREPNCKVAANAFIRNAPTVSEWNKRLLSIGINFSTGHLAQTIQLVSDRDFGLICQEIRQPVALFERATTYARVTASYMKGADLADSLARFQLFRFLSYCLVLEKLRLMPLDDINKIMRVAIADGSDYFLKRLRTRTEWLHKNVVMKLVQAGWTMCRATLLFFFSGPRRPYEYADLNLESLEYIVSQLQRPEYLFPGPDRNIDFSMSTCIVTWEPKLRLDEVRTALESFDNSDRAMLPISNLPHAPQIQAFHPRLVSRSNTNNHQSRQSSNPPPVVTLSPGIQGNIRRLEQWSPQAHKFFTFLCALDSDDIPEALFCRMWSPREHWGTEGEVECNSISVVDPFVELLTNATYFHDNIRILESCGLIGSTSGPLRMRKFFIEPGVRTFMNKDIPNLERLEWIRVVLICHAFPGRAEEKGFGDIGRTLLPHIRHAFQKCRDLSERIIHEPSAGYSILLSLLLSSRLLGREWKVQALGLADKMLSDKPPIGNAEAYYLRMLAEQRRRDVSRRFRNISIDSPHEPQLPIDPRTNALYGELLRSKAQERIMQHDHDGALDALNSFSFFHTHPTSIEMEESKQHLLIKGKICRWNAEFSRACDIFYELLISRDSQFDETGCNITGHLIGSLCERGLVMDAEQMARHALTSWTKLNRQGLSTYRNLQTSLVEALVCHGLLAKVEGRTLSEEVYLKLNDADRRCAKLKEELDVSRGEGTWNSEFIYLRVCFGRALIAHLKGHYAQALDLWNEVRQPAEILQDKVTEFTPMIIDYSSCDASLKLGNMDEAQKFLDRARRYYTQIGREHWWTGLGTFWLSYLRCSIPDSGIEAEIKTGSIASKL